jgi:hypothetical protein
MENADSVSVKKIKPFFHKPPSTYQDTLIVRRQAAVFYQPDSLQLAKIKAQTDTRVYESSIHEYFYQIRNARMVIKKTWPSLTITESKNCRYLLFIKKDGSRESIDVDTKNDAYGLIVFDGKKGPLMVDMMNVETQVSFYLKER